ncbi:hypothetical protein QQX98_000350 [Neonectria punicea]|uniref:F-box domain-containing protein n=1 Tax=Neonectria punicea TaxID=979145 RepID=A0ABR1HUA6_9HYPO
MSVPWAASAIKNLRSLRETLVPGRRRRRRPSTNVDNVQKLFQPQVISQTCQYLSDVDYAALSLSCRLALSILGRDALKLCPGDKFLLLQRLERDGYRKYEILCPVCQYFHLPRFNPGETPTESEGERACLNHKTERMEAFGDLRPLRFDMVAAILRSHRHKNGIYDASIMDLDQNYLARSSAEARVWVRCKVIHDQLFVKTDLFLMPRVPRRDSSAVVPLLKEILEINHHLMDLCQHYKWDSMQYILEGFEPDADLATRFAHNCLWNHGTRCNRGRRRGDETPHRVTNKRACDLCCTAIAVSCCDLRDGSSMVALTTWKNYGHGLDVNDPIWLSHNKTGGISGGEAYQFNPELFTGTFFVKDGEYPPFRGIPDW